MAGLFVVAVVAGCGGSDDSAKRSEANPCDENQTQPGRVEYVTTSGKGYRASIAGPVSNPPCKIILIPRGDNRPRIKVEVADPPAQALDNVGHCVEFEMPERFGSLKPTGLVSPRRATELIRAPACTTMEPHVVG